MILFQRLWLCEVAKMIHLNFCPLHIQRDI